MTVNARRLAPNCQTKIRVRFEDLMTNIAGCPNLSCGQTQFVPMGHGSRFKPVGLGPANWLECVHFDESSTEQCMVMTPGADHPFLSLRTALYSPYSYGGKTTVYHLSKRGALRLEIASLHDKGRYRRVEEKHWTALGYSDMSLFPPMMRLISSLGGTKQKKGDDSNNNPDNSDAYPGST